MNTVLEENRVAKNTINRTDKTFGEKIGVFGKVFGCWHKELTRPFTAERESYRACVECGARRHFDAKTLKTFGSFYYPPAISLADEKR